MQKAISGNSTREWILFTYIYFCNWFVEGITIYENKWIWARVCVFPLLFSFRKTNILSKSKENMKNIKDFCILVCCSTSMGTFFCMSLWISIWLSGSSSRWFLLPHTITQPAPPHSPCFFLFISSLLSLSTMMIKTSQCVSYSIECVWIRFECNTLKRYIPRSFSPSEMLLAMTYIQHTSKWMVKCKSSLLIYFLLSHSIFFGLLLLLMLLLLLPVMVCFGSYHRYIYWVTQYLRICSTQSHNDRQTKWKWRMNFG